jgi:diacylglycerol kinase (ATP)
VNADAVPAQDDRPVRCLVVLNEHSRTGAASAGLVMTALEEQGALVVGGRRLPPEALEGALRDLRPGEADRVLLGGGDGTLNAALPALLGADLPLGVLPLGTANDLASSLGIPPVPEDAVRTALRGRRVPIDVGRVNGKPFLNVASLGLGPRVTRRLSSELKARLGFLGYPHALIRAWRDSAPFRAWIRVDGGPERRLRCIHLAVGNGRRYGGGAVISENARLDDGQLHLLALAPMPLWRLLLMAPWLGSGRHRGLDDALVLSGTRFDVKTTRPRSISADGEILARTPARFDVLPGALTVMVPPENPEEGAALSAASGPAAEEDKPQMNANERK